MNIRYGKATQVTVRQDGRAILATVIFEDEIDLQIGSKSSYTYVSPSSMTRLARAINSLGMQVTLDEYGVPTWTRVSESQPL